MSHTRGKWLPLSTRSMRKTKHHRDHTKKKNGKERKAISHFSKNSPSSLTAGIWNQKKKHSCSDFERHHLLMQTHNHWSRQERTAGESKMGRFSHLIHTWSVTATTGVTATTAALSTAFKIENPWVEEGSSAFSHRLKWRVSSLQSCLLRSTSKAEILWERLQVSL